MPRTWMKPVPAPLAALLLVLGAAPAPAPPPAAPAPPPAAPPPAALPPAAPPPAAPPPAAPALTVNGQPVSEVEVQRAVNLHVQRTMYHRNPKPEQLAEARAKVVEQLVVEELRAQEARRRGLAAPDEQLADVTAAEERAAGGPAALDKALRDAGLDRARYRAIIARPLLAQLLADAEAAKAPAPTRDEALARYKASPERYTMPPAAHLRELCVKVEPWADEAGWEAGRQRAAALRERALKGEDFARLAREAGGDPYAAQGGDLGWVHKGSLDQALEGAGWALADGATSEPVRALRGWHVVRREATRPGVLAPFEQVQAAIVEELRRERRDQALKALDARLRGSAKVEVRAATR